MFHPKRLIIAVSVFLIWCLLFYFSFPSWKPKKNLDAELEYLYHLPYPIVKQSENPVNISASEIAIVVVLAEGVERDYYKVAIDSVECYCKAHSYELVLTHDNIWGCDYLEDKFFRRHCVIAKILPKYAAVLHLDADIGVVNPNRKLEDFLDDNFDVTFHDRHFGPEIGMASYFVRNTEYSRKLITEFANYEKSLPMGSYHGTDNGAIHMFLAEKMFSNSSIELEICRQAWQNSRNVVDQFAYTACARSIIGAGTSFGKIRILKKGTGYVRDDWLTSGMWSPNRDFMLHGWKTKQVARIPDGPVLPAQMNNGQWYNPFLGDFDLEKCALGNTTWLYNEKLIASREAIEYELRKYEVKIAMKKIELYSGLYDLIQNTQFRSFFQVSIDSFFS